MLNSTQIATKPNFHFYLFLYRFRETSSTPTKMIFGCKGGKWGSYFTIKFFWRDLSVYAELRRTLGVRARGAQTFENYVRKSNIIIFFTF